MTKILHVAVTAVLLGMFSGIVEAFEQLFWTGLRESDVLWLFPVGNALIVLLCGVTVYAVASWLRLRFAETLALFTISAVAVFYPVKYFVFELTPKLSRNSKTGVWYVIAMLLAWLVTVACRRFKEHLGLIAAATTISLLLLAFGLHLTRSRNERQTLAALPAANSKAPNVVLVILDAVRADHIGAYGYSRNTSPFIDELSREGVLFENAISASSWSLPTHASLMTGVYPHEHGVQGPSDALSENQRTLAQLLSQQGYATAAFSANCWFFSRRGKLDRGFAHFENCSPDLKKCWPGLLLANCFLRTSRRFSAPLALQFGPRILSLLRWT